MRRPPLSGELALLILLADERDALAFARLLAGVRSAGGAGARFLVPPVRGLAFFADEDGQPELDAWWSAEVPRSSRPVYVLMDEEDLEGWVDGVDGDVYVGVRDPARLPVYARAAAASRRARIRAMQCAGPLDLAAALMQDLSGGRAGDLAVFDAAEALRMAALSPRFPLRPEPPAEVGMRDGDGLAAPPVPAGVAAAQPPGPPVPAPFEAGPGGVAPPRPLSRILPDLLSGLLGRHPYRPRSDAEVAALLVNRGPTIVVTGSRKGGVGKTSFAAGIAIVAGTVLDQVGHRACIVDANIANPDAWGELRLPPEAATVRDTVAALLANQEPPPPIHAATPALACYPEARDATEYSRTAVRLLADHLRRRYTLIVVDMSNRLPDPTSGPDAAVAAYWLEVADVLVLPTTSARADFNGALDYLEVRGLPPTLVPYIVPGSRRLRDNPTTREYLRVIRRRAHALIEVPDEANAVRLAGLEGVPVEQLSAGLGLAYRRLTETIAAMPRRPGR